LKTNPGTLSQRGFLPTASGHLSVRHFVEKWKVDESCAWPVDSETWCNRHRQYLLNRQLGVGRVVKSAIKSVLPARLYAALGGAADRSFGHA
jgi:hypothetical protein